MSHKIARRPENMLEFAEVTTPALPLLKWKTAPLLILFQKSQFWTIDVRKLTVFAERARPIVECETNLLGCFYRGAHGLQALCSPAADGNVILHTMQKFAKRAP